MGNLVPVACEGGCMQQKKEITTESVLNLWGWQKWYGQEQVKWHTQHCPVQEEKQIYHHGDEKDESPGNSMVSSQPPCFPWFIFYPTHQGRIPALPWAKHDLFQGEVISDTSEISSPNSPEGSCYGSLWRRFLVAPKLICWKITW